MALGTIGILLILVVGLANTYIREFKLSRTTYNDIIASAGAEGIFEYGMLKIRNHREGFSDSTTSLDPDGQMFSLFTDRSKWLHVSYDIQANSLDKTFSLAPNEHLIIPLFVANEAIIPGAIASRYPARGNATSKTEALSVEWLDSLEWTIVAQGASESVWLTWSWDIQGSKNGVIRHKGIQCYSSDGSIVADCSQTRTQEELQYFWDESKRVSDFLWDRGVVDPYLMIYNTDTAVKNIHITAKTPFALPSMTIETTAQKNDSSQVYRFTEDKSRYYDALKYGVYNN